ncbi:MAG: hypothetical protein KAH13_05445 [Tenericutes bacterium]|nr:hypothetical protein [Mycoplasmatota bacterium]
MKIIKKIVLVILIVFTLAIIIPRSDYKLENIWLKESNDNKPLVMAHAGGKGVFPGNTRSAFDYSYNLGVDVLEMDVQMTKDNILVLRHGENNTGNIRSMSNCDALIWEENYSYLYDSCNVGYNFGDDDGDFPYRDLTHEEWVDAKVYLTTLEELFIAYGDTILYNIEIKADGEAPRTETADELYDLLLEYGLLEETLVATSFEDISLYIKDTYPDVTLSASHSEAQNVIIMSLTFTSVFYNPTSYSSLQIPTSFEIPVINELNLTNKLLISNLHRHNMAVHYWTINDEAEMRRLIEQGCDGIITDYPELLISIINEAEE